MQVAYGDEQDTATAAELLRPPPDGAFAWYPVSTAVNRVSNDNAQLILPMAESEPPPLQPPPPKRAARTSPPAKASRDDGGQGSLF